VPPEEHEKLKVLRFGDFSVILEPHLIDYMAIEEAGAAAHEAADEEE
jgi:hypothetical protein